MLKQPVVIVSGGSRGLGSALVAHFLGRGFTVATCSRSGSDFIEHLQRSHRTDRFLWKAVDLSNRDEIKAFVATVQRQWGSIDILINNAAALVEQVLPLMRADEIERLIALNLTAVIQLSRLCSRQMLCQAEGGTIINISSINSIRGFNGVAVYSATKAALDGFTRSIARELGPRGIRVNSVAPGHFNSDMVADFARRERTRLLRRTPLQRLGTAADVVGVVDFLISPAASFMTGQTLVVDGGLTC
jgi:3-oxoacyl-[acyl-carrier protein] reductase